MIPRKHIKPVTVQTADYVVDPQTDYTIIAETGCGVVSLPQAPHIGQVFSIASNSSVPVVVNVFNGGFIQGVGFLSIFGGESVHLQNSGHGSYQVLADGPLGVTTSNSNISGHDTHHNKAVIAAEGAANTGDFSIVSGFMNTSNSAGSSSIVSGNGNVNNGAHSLVAGITNTNDFQNSVICGSTNTNANNNNVFCGTQNSFSGASSFVGGDQNSGTGNACLLVGTANANNVPHSMISGSSNTNNGSSSIVTGISNNNTVDGANSICYGNGNVNSSSQSLVGGTGNTNSGVNAIVVGQGNINTEGDRSILAGQNNSNTDAAIDCIVSGSGNTNTGRYSIVSGQNCNNVHHGSLVVGINNDNAVARYSIITGVGNSTTTDGENIGIIGSRSVDVDDSNDTFVAGVKSSGIADSNGCVFLGFDNASGTFSASGDTSKTFVGDLVIRNGSAGLTSVPTSSTLGVGWDGQIIFDTDYLYIRVADGANKWKRVALSVF